MRRTVLAILAAAIAAPATACAAGDVIVAQTAPDTVLIWRVNETLAGALRTHPTPEALADELVSAALGRMLHSLPAGAKPHGLVTMKIVYFNDGGYDPNYRIETVSGVRRVGEIASPADRIRRSIAAWQRELSHGRMPAGLSAHFEPGAFDGL